MLQRLIVVTCMVALGLSKCCGRASPSAALWIARSDSIQDMGVNHRRADFRVPEELRGPRAARSNRPGARMQLPGMPSKYRPAVFLTTSTDSSKARTCAAGLRPRRESGADRGQCWQCEAVGAISLIHRSTAARCFVSPRGQTRSTRTRKPSVLDG
jgi:hypothetical protein